VTIAIGIPKKTEGQWAVCADRREQGGIQTKKVLGEYITSRYLKSGWVITSVVVVVKTKKNRPEKQKKTGKEHYPYQGGELVEGGTLKGEWPGKRGRVGGMVQQKGQT